MVDSPSGGLFFFMLKCYLLLWASERRYFASFSDGILYSLEQPLISPFWGKFGERTAKSRNRGLE